MTLKLDERTQGFLEKATLTQLLPLCPSKNAYCFAGFEDWRYLSGFLLKSFTHSLQQK